MMILMGLGTALFTSNLPSCTSVLFGTPCIAPDGTALFLPICDNVQPGTPCETGVAAGGPMPTDSADAPIETISSTPGALLDPDAQAVADRAKLVAQLKKWGTALAIGVGIGLLAFKVKG